MKTSFKFNDNNIYITAQLIDGRAGYSTITDSEELKEKYSSILRPLRIKSLELSSDIVSPLLTATIIYEDDDFELLMNTHGNLDLQCKLTIRLSPVRLEEYVADEDIVFDHDFYVDNVEVFGNSDGVVSYKIDLISSLFFTFMSNRPISTFKGDSETEPPLDVLGRLFQDPLSLNTERSKDSGESVRHISAANEMVIDSVSSILNKTMSSPESDLMLLPYDHMEKRYDIWFKSVFEQDISNMEDVNFDKFRKAIKINVESVSDYDLLGNEAANIGTKNFKTNKDILKSTRKSIRHDFDFTTRSFTNKYWDKSLIESSFGSKISSTGYNNRIKSDLSWFSADSKIFQNETSHWNENSDPYFFEGALDCLIKNGTVVINTAGNIYREPGIDMFIIVDHSTKDYSLLNLQGRWLLTKVRHVFKPQEETYSNSLMLSRVDIPDDAREFRDAT